MKLVSLVIVALFTALAAAAPPARVLTLSRAIELALANQPTLREARANTEAAAGRVDQAAAGYLPSLTGTGLYQRTTGNFAPRPGATVTLQTPTSWSTKSYDFFNFGVTASQLIYDFGQTSGRRRAAEASREATRATEQSREVQVVEGVRQAYFQVLAQQELLRVGREAFDNQQRHLVQTEGLVRAGIQPDIDLARVRTDLANARVAVINAENGVATGRATLAQAIGLRDAAFDALEDDADRPVTGEDGDLDKIAQEALVARPEVVSLLRARRAQEASIAALRGGYGPSLGASAGASEAGTNLDRLVPNWVVGATLTWPILQGGLTTGQLREARANLAAVDAQLDTLRLQVHVEVEQARLAVRAAKAAGVAAQEAVVNAREQLRLAEGRYTAGLGSIIEQGDAQVALTNTEAQAVQARYNLATARAQLLAALGKR